MNRLLEIAATCLGGVSLFAVCFFGFAAMAGVPLHDMAVVGGMFPEPAEPADPQQEVDPTLAGLGDPGRGAEVLESSLGVLGAWRLAPPFSEGELKALADELKLKRVQLERGEVEQKARDAELDAREDAIAAQFQALDELRARLEAYELELALRAEEVARDEATAAERDDRVHAKLAALLATQDAAEAGRRLAAYEPAEATRILLHLEEDFALEVLNTFTGDAYLRYAEAWAEAASETP